MTQFRFHTGSIKSYKGDPVSALAREMFRFHTGSIKSMRLKTSVEIASESFDSILVRLKDGLLVYETVSSDLFRFHTGSIKSGETGHGEV